MSDDASGWAVDVDELPDRTVLRVSGDLDLETAPRLLAHADRYLASGRGGLIVDLSRLTFIDSSGLSALIRMFQHMSATDRLFEIISPRPPVTNAFEITGLDQVLPLRRP